jgi:uncharacterized delta-60 repeat protein
MKRRIFKGYIFSTSLLIFILAGNVQTKNMTSFNIYRAMENYGIVNQCDSDSSNQELPPSQKKAAEKRTEGRARARQNFKLDREFTRKSWARVYGDILNDGAACIHQTNDGGYIVAGYYSFLLGLSGMDAWLIKFSPEGKIQWQRAYGGTGVDCASSIQQTPDGGYIVAGYTSPSDMLSRDFWVLKLDSSGNIEWQKAYGGSAEDWAASIGQTNDGGYIVVGITTSFGAGDYDFWILKLSPNGDIEWQRAYGGENFDSAQSIQQTRDGGYIVAGYSSSFVAQYADIWLLKLSNKGDIEWQRTYGGDGSEWTTSIQQTNDGSYILAGYSSSFSLSSGDIWVLKLFPNGDIEWQRAYKGNESDGAHSIQQTRDGGIIVAGFTESFGAGGRDVWILKLNSIGEIEWQRTYGGNGDDWAHFIQQTSDGGYIVAGKTISLLGRGGGDLLILKIDSAGWIERVPEFIGESNAEVLDTSIIPQDTNVTPQDTNIAAQVTNKMSSYTSERDNLLFSPPLNFTGSRIFNRSLSQAEYIDLLTWEPNPNNNDLNIAKYRVYRIEYGEKNLLAELDANTFKYVARKVWKSIQYTYAIAGVTDKNEEGLPTFVTVR